MGWKVKDNKFNVDELTESSIEQETIIKKNRFLLHNIINELRVNNIHQELLTEENIKYRDINGDLSR